MAYNKFYAKKVMVRGMKFDSIKEARRYNELLLLQRAGELRDLKRQVPFVLLPAQREESNGKSAVWLSIRSNILQILPIRTSMVVLSLRTLRASERKNI